VIDWQSMKPCMLCGKPTHQVYGNAANAYPCCMECYSELPKRVLDYQLPNTPQKLGL